MLDSEIIHKKLDSMGFLIETGKTDPSYAYEHCLGENVYLYVKRKKGGVVSKSPLVLHPDCKRHKAIIDSIDGVYVNWLEPRMNSSYRRYPKWQGKSQYGYEVDIDSNQSLENLVDVVEKLKERDSMDDARVVETKNQEPQVMPALNQILYGPPGTGKTYKTTEMAVEIVEPLKYREIKDSDKSEQDQRSAIKALYDDLARKQRIAFTTFHQSFSYEDFIEGIRAVPSDEGDSIAYRIEDGVFKALANRADRAIGNPDRLGLSQEPKIWKISIGRKQQADLRNRCIEAGEARIGWNALGDLSVDYEEWSKDEQSYWSGLSKKTHATIKSFAEDMARGDVLLCLKDAETVQAVGIVTSDYYYEPQSLEGGEPGYAHARKVNWVLKDIEFNIKPINSGLRLVQQTVYQLNRISWGDLESELIRQGFNLPFGTSQDLEERSKPNFVLIIDEINRGNIARIFGELITLLETDKRKGGGDSRTAILPYSKEEFSVPSNLFLIGTMNTADKSLAQLDLALRRRFEFVELLPDTALLECVEVFGVSMD